MRFQTLLLNCSSSWHLIANPIDCNFKRLWRGYYQMPQKRNQFLLVFIVIDVCHTLLELKLKNILF